MQLIEDIVEWNREAGLLGKGADSRLEDAFLIEEALEGNDISLLSALLVPSVLTMNPKMLSRAIIGVCCYEEAPKISKIDQADKAVDAIVYSIGRLAKLGLDAQGIEDAISIVMTANMAKLGCDKDEHGKLLKPPGFEELYAPEKHLEALFTQQGID